MRISSPPKEIIKDIQYFKGLKININNTQIDIENSPDMLNLLADDRGALDKRFGKINVFSSIGAGKIKMIDEFKKSTGSITVFAHGTKLYKLVGDVYTEIHNGIDGEVNGFNFNDNYYFKDESAYYVYDGTTVTDVVGKIPVEFIGTPPAGGGTAFENANLISAGHTQRFNGNGSATAYTLAYQNLDADLLIITVNGASKTETVDFNVNRTTGIVTFTVAPPTGEDNVEITFFKDLGLENEILGCTTLYIWGGTDGTRVFLTGNPNFKYRDYWSDVLDPTYFPTLNTDNVGVFSSGIQGYSELYDRMIIIKEDEIYARQQLIENNEIVFRAYRLSRGVGCVAKKSIQILDSIPTFLSKKGVYQVVSIDPQNERNIKHISDDIDKNVNSLAIDGILEMENLDSYVSIDFNNKYWLFNPNGYVWVYDYRYIVSGTGQWFLLDNLASGDVVEIDGNMFIGDYNNGIVYRMMNSSDENPYSDVTDDVADVINAYWTSKIFNFQTFTNLKLVSKVFITLKPLKNSMVNVYSRSDNKTLWKLIKTFRVSLFVYSLLTYSTFTYGGSDFPQTRRIKTKNKKIGYYQLKFENDELSSFLGMINISIKLQYQREWK